MKIKAEQDLSCSEIEVTIKYPQKSRQVNHIIDLLESVYHTDFRLYQLRNSLRKHGFVQISKSCILNINMLESIRPLINSRMEATLKNGEKVYINRNYLNEIKMALKGDEEI